MGKGILKITKSNKGKIIVHLDRLNGKTPVPLSYVTFPDDKYADKDCEYQSDSSGRITSISVDGQIIFGKNFDVPPPVTPSREPQSSTNSQPKPVSYTINQEYSDSLNLNYTKLPKAVRNLGIADIDNFSLKLNKAARYENDGPKKNSFVFFRNDYKKRKDGSETGAQYFIKANFGSVNFAQIGARQKSQAEALFGNNYNLLQFSPDWRLICGLSGGIYETNMTLHHVYGVPYIPASSIKGVLRSWVISNLFAANTKEEIDYPLVNAEYRAVSTSKLFCDIFGAPESISRVKFNEGKPVVKKEKFEIEKEKPAVGKEKQGIVCFLEGLPVVPPEVLPDIMNPHYPDWYSEKELPTDFQSPNPIVFLTLSNKSRFQIGIGVSERFNKPIKSQWPEEVHLYANPVNLTGDATVLELVMAWVKKALSEHGIGAKTAVGYGILK